MEIPYELQILSLCLFRTVRLLTIIQWKSICLFFFHLFCMFKYYCACKNHACLVILHLSLHFSLFFLCCLPDLGVQLFSKSSSSVPFLIYWNTLRRFLLSSTFFLPAISVFLSGSLPPFCLGFYFVISDLPPVLFPFPLPALPLPVYTTCFMRVLHKFRSLHHWGIHLII